VIGSEDGGVLAGLNQIRCSVNDGPPFGLGGISAASGYTGSFELAQNGSDKISCSATTVAGITQTTPAMATVNVDNPNYSPSASSLIDNGNDPYSNGPSQSKWYVTPQSVTITADNTGGSAPIAAISCKGALSGTWPISNLNRDSAGGEQITVTVSAPGGDLSCTAEDAAGNVYVLGSYLFQIDDTPPTGYFVPRATWPAPDAIEIHATDNGGSGVALVKVYGESPDVEQGQPQLVGDARYDTSTGEYVVTLPDGVSPWVAANWTFYANVVDVAGNQGRVSAGADGSSEDLTLPLREDTSVTARAERVAATPEPAIPGALASAAGLPSQPSAAIAGRVRRAPRARAATAARSRRREAAAGIVRVAYGRALTITGTLTDLSHQGTPISGSQVVIYEQIKGAGSYTKVGSVITNRAGSYRYRVPPGASRTLYVVYPGSAELRPAASRMFVRSAGSVSLRASRIEAGGELVIDGQVRGGYIPHGGLEVTIDYRQLGAPGSGTLGTVHTDPRGDFRFTQHFSRDTRGLRYELWAVVPRNQPGWPYSGASAPPVLRRVG
jgi:hypothetical protein